MEAKINAIKNSIRTFAPSDMPLFNSSNTQTKKPIIKVMVSALNKIYLITFTILVIPS